MLCTLAFPFRQRRDTDCRTILTVEGVPGGEWLEVEVPEEGFVLGVVWFHFTLVYVLKLFLSDNHLSLSPGQYI